MLVGCLALEKFLRDEHRLDDLNHHFDKGTVRIEYPLSPNKNKEQKTVYQQTRSIAGSYKLNINDAEMLIETLFTAMQAEISETDFFHDKAFLCLL